MTSVLIILSSKYVVYFNYFAWNMFFLLLEHLNSVKNYMYFILFISKFRYFSYICREFLTESICY
jgi:hypothetical protein